MISFFPLLLDMIPLPLGAIYPVLIVIAFEVIMGYAWANASSVMTGWGVGLTSSYLRYLGNISGVACKLAGRERAASVQNSRNTGYASNVSKILRVK